MEEKRTPYYAGRAFANPDYADGQLPHAVGASNYQVTRANRRHPEWADGLGYTYNHAPMLTYWRGKYYIEYVTNPADEHTLGGCSLLCASKDGVSWDKPVVSFPMIKVPAGVYRCADGREVVVPEPRDAFMHQRMAFFHSNDDRLLVSGFYGHVPHHSICPWVNYGMGRAVREIFEDGSMGPIYFLRILEDSGWTEELLPYPHFTRSADRGFVNACEEFLADALVTQQWAEEHGDRDEYVRIKAKAADAPAGGALGPMERRSSFCWYHIDEKTVIALWKQAVVGRSDDGGETWTIAKEPSFATSGAKAWGQRTQDGLFAIAYVNSLSSEHRYPLCVVTSNDGVRFDGLAAAFGETPPRRYEGLYKDFGPQYLRGVCEGHREYPKDAMWLCHSVNKEDIWATRIPVPIKNAVETHADDRFDGDGPYIEGWNIYSPIWAPVRKAALPGNVRCMRIADREPVDYARAERVFPDSVRVKATIEMLPAKFYEEKFYIELTDEKGNVACRVALGDGRELSAQTTSVMLPVAQVGRDLEWLQIGIEADCEKCRYAVTLNGEPVKIPVLVLRQKVNSLSRLILRTKPARRAPGVDERPLTPDMAKADEPAVTEGAYFIRYVKTAEAPARDWPV